MSETTDLDLARSEIASFIGTPEAVWDARTAVDVESSIRKGIESVVHCGIHQWSWMRPTHRFQTADGQRTYTLPLDFEQFLNNLYFDGENYQYPSITQLPAGRLQQMHSEYSSTGVPTNYALAIQSHDGTSPQHYQLILHPTPDGEYSLIGPYQVGPIRSLSNERPWFPGGPEHRELFIAAILAATEAKFMDGKADKFESFQMALQSAIARDHRRQPRNLGQMGGRRGRSRDYYRYKLSTTYDGAQEL
ncbi:hypothetical protein KKH23_05835 [Patescibacteria group bacterium]|nr:hypothetical protein [Patescibacteria group bacterium]